MKNLSTLIKNVSNFASKQKPALLAGTAIVGLIYTGYLSYKTGSKAEKILEEYKKDLSLCAPEDKEAKRTVRMETTKKMLPIVIPPVIIGGATAACILGSHSESARRIAALSTAYNISEEAVKRLNIKMNDILGEKKARSIKDAIMKDKLTSDKNEMIEESSIVITGSGDHLCKDLYTGRFFRGNAQTIEQAIIKLSSDVLSEMYVSLNEFYDEIGLERIPNGDDVGWNVDDVYRGKLPITMTAILTADKQPCLCIDCDIFVRKDYRNLY